MTDDGSPRLTLVRHPKSVGGPLVAFLLWVVVTASYTWITWSTFSIDNLAKVAVPTAAVIVAFYIAWHNTSTSAVERQAAQRRHDEAMRQRDVQHQELLARDRIRRAFDILRSLDEQDRVNLRVDIRKEFEKITDDGPAIKAKLGDDKLLLSPKIAKVLGSFEDMAIAIRSGEADESILFYSMSIVLVTFYEMLRLHIDHKREETKLSLPPAYCELEHVAKSWKDRRSAVHAGTVFDFTKRPWT